MTTTTILPATSRGGIRCGWRWEFTVDLLAPEMECEGCGRKIRYLHGLMHDERADLLGVGGCCVAGLTGDTRGPARAIRRLRRIRRAVRLLKHAGYPGLDDACCPAVTAGDLDP